VIDASNESDEYLRNRIRKALPALQTADARFDANFMETVARLQETEDYLNNQMLALYATICTNHELTIPLFFQQHAVMRTRILLHWLCQHNARFTPSTALFDEIERFLNQPGTGSHTFYNLWKIEKKNGKALISFK
jgi:tRNA(Ile)-lysidine synthase TilS/MesJ